MKLLFDIGNTLIKWAHYSEGRVGSSTSIDTANVSLAELTKTFADVNRPEEIWVSSVGSEQALNAIVEWSIETHGLKPNVIQVSDSSCGIRNNYLTRDTLGVDRWVAAIGARVVIPAGHVIIVDAGTAVTIDWLSDDNIYEGGVILPGLSLMHASLNSKTAGIKSIYTQADKIIGRTTEECVNSGVSYGLIGGVERVIEEMMLKIPEPATILLTGGSASILMAMSKLEMSLQENLVLLGVAKVSNEVT